MGQKGFLGLEVQGMQWNTVFTYAVPVALSKFSQNQNLTFRVDRTVLDVLAM